MRTFLLLASFLLVIGVVSAQDAESPVSQFRDIEQSFGGRLGVAAKSLETGETILFHHDSLFPTASIIKLPVLVEYFYQVHEGKLAFDTPLPLRDSLKKPGSGILQFMREGQSLKLIDIATLMIILSDNSATNYVIDQFGTEHDEKLEAVNSRMRSLGLKETKLLNKLYSWATKKKTEEAKRFGIGVTSPADMVILLERIAGNEIPNPALCDTMIGILRAQQDFLMGPRLLPFVEDSTLRVGNKTGSLDDVKNDVGLVTSERGNYVYAIFCDESKDEGEQVDNRATLAAARVSRLLYDYFLGRR